MEFVIRVFKTLFFSLDKVVYGLIDDVYGLLIQLARTSIFSQSSINAFAERIYALIGIFMLFKISVSLINYVINPDDFSDKEKGFSQIVKRVILSLVMIVLLPYVFTEAFELQSIILEENTLMALVFGVPQGTDTSSISGQSYIETAGERMQFTIMYNFAQPNFEEFTGNSEFDLIDCRHPYDTYSNDYADVKNGKASVGDYVFRKLDTTGDERSMFIYQLNPSCFGYYDMTQHIYLADGDDGAPALDDDSYEELKGLESYGHLKKLFDNSELGLVYQDYANGVAYQNFDMMFKKNVILARESEPVGIDDNGDATARYFIDYKMGVSTAVGVATIYLLLMFCIDVAIRSVKLGFLQMIAPIPILSYCDPKSSKDGMFQRWTKMCVTTYLDLFFRLAALYFGIYVISLVGSFRDVVTGDLVSNPLVNVFMILGVLIFVKKLPDIIKEIFSIKGDGKFTLNPLKRIGDEALGGKAIAGVGRKAVGLGAGLGTAGLVGAAGFMTGQGIHRGALGKAIVGGLRGDKFGKNFANSYSAGHQRHLQFKEARAQGLDASDVRAAEGRTGRRLNLATSANQHVLDAQQQYFDKITAMSETGKRLKREYEAAVQTGDAQAREDTKRALDKWVNDVASDVRNGTDVSGIGAEGRKELRAYQRNLDSAVATANKSGKDVGGYTEITYDGGLTGVEGAAKRNKGDMEVANSDIIAAGQIQPGGKPGGKGH